MRMIEVVVLEIKIIEIRWKEGWIGRIKNILVVSNLVWNFFRISIDK